MVGKFEESVPYADFAKNIVNTYTNLEDLQKDWAEIERQLLENLDLLKFASTFKNALVASSINGY